MSATSNYATWKTTWLCGLQDQLSVAHFTGSTEVGVYGLLISQNFSKRIFCIQIAMAVTQSK